MASPSDSDLVLTAQAGDREAFGQLVERYRHAVFGVCYRITANRADAEDLAHDAFVEAFLKLDQLRETERIGGWLRTIALNLCRMWYRRRPVGQERLEEEPIAAGDDDGDQADLRRLARARRFETPWTPSRKRKT